MRGVDFVKNLYDAYAKRDIVGALAHCSDDVVFSWVAEPQAPFNQVGQRQAGVPCPPHVAGQ